MENGEAMAYLARNPGADRRLLVSVQSQLEIQEL